MILILLLRQVFVLEKKKTMAHDLGLTESIAGTSDLLPVDFALSKREGVCTSAPPAAEESASRTDRRNDVRAASAPSSQPATFDSRFVSLPWILLVERCVVTCSAALAVIIFVFGLGSTGEHGSTEVHPSQHTAAFAVTSDADQEFLKATIIADEFALFRNHSFVLEFWEERPDNGTSGNNASFLEVVDTSIGEANSSLSVTVKKSSP
ncbi:hypothetical protein V5799_030515 [Amblyomma americanum]|uniref:Uncharacterized protein n=1 Tax=Amblyomma americanum TaxID=6943 RepID=A0AAQ4EN63_AMBAM